MGVTSNHDRDAHGLTRAGTPRLVGLDVTRAIALIGVVLMNYCGALLDPSGDSWSDRLLNPYTGVLSTRFAATFVLVAGIGVTLMTRRADHRDARRDVTWRLARRGLLLYAGGYALNWVWPGTILFYYGAYFVLAALLFRLATRWLVVVGVASAVVATTVRTWIEWRVENGPFPEWAYTSDVNGFRDLAVRTFIDYTHPVFPWLTFLVAGMIVGRHLDTVRRRANRVIVSALAVLTTTYAAATMIDRSSLRDDIVGWNLTSMQPFQQSLFYVVSTLAIALVAFVSVSWVSERFENRPPVVALRRAGQSTLSLYLLHVLAYYAVVDWSGVGVDGAGSVIAFAASFWALAIVVGSWWHHRVGEGPAERVYRAIGG